MNNFDGNVTVADPGEESLLAIAHDIHQVTAYDLTAHMIATLQSEGFTGVTMGTCMGDASGNWYRSAPAASRVATSSVFTPPGGASTVSSSGTRSASATPTANGQTSPDSSCAQNGGYTCIGFSAGECCSQ